MTNLQAWQDRIKEKRKNTDFRQYIKEIASFFPVVLYRNSGHISKYPVSNRIAGVQNSEDFEKQRDDMCSLGKEYDFKQDIFSNISTLLKTIEMPNFFTYGGTENSPYADITYNTKNAYLSFNSIYDNENIFYSCFTKDGCKNIFNSIMTWDTCENVYFGFGIIKSYKVYYSKYIVNSDNIWLSSNLMGCRECILCDDLMNKKYCIENIEYPKEEYFERKKKMLNDKHKFLEKYKEIHSTGKNFASKDITGSFIIESQNIENGNLVYQVNGGRNLFVTGSQKGNEEMYDVFIGGSNVSKSVYACCNTGTSENVYIGDAVGMSSNVYYSIYMQDCSFCIGCIGLKNKSYCILNKQYTKAKWEEMADKIFKQMDDQGILGGFFPGELNPFYFNDTMADILGNFTKEEVEAAGYMWRDEEIKVDIPEGSDVISTGELAQYQGFTKSSEWRINPDILKKVIKDENGNYYRIVEMEYDFLVKHELPLPSLHWMDRMRVNFGINT